MQITIEFEDMPDLKKKIADAHAFFQKESGEGEQPEPAEGKDAEAPAKPKRGRPPKDKAAEAEKTDKTEAKADEKPADKPAPADVKPAPAGGAEPQALRDRAIAATSKLIEMEKKDTARELINKTGHSKVKEVPEDKLPQLVADLEAAVNGGGDLL